jgi:hypothetical protein
MAREKPGIPFSLDPLLGGITIPVGLKNRNNRRSLPIFF